MRKILTYAVSALALASCSSDSLVSDSPANTQAPIAFTAGQKNITRTALEEAGFSNFGVWAYKIKSGSFDVVMNNYQVGCAGYGDFESSTLTKGEWFYDGIGSQILRYWDHSTEKTNFYAYAPYNADVKFDAEKKQITVPASVNTAGFTKASDFVYAGNSVVKDKYNNAVDLKFKRLGALVNLKFYTDIKGYKVELIDADPATSGSAIQATPAIYDENATGEKYKLGSYYDSYKALIDFSTNASKPSVKTTGTPVQTNLKFDLLTDNTVPAAVETGSTQTYLEPATYYAVAQPTDSETGFTFHVSYKLTANDNSEVITVRDARVFIPASVTDKVTNITTYIAAWQPNTQYTYTFKITANTNGKTAEETINLEDPSVPSDAGLYPIVFDSITIEDMTNVEY